MNNIVIGGTWNKLHKGHKELLKLAFLMAGDEGYVSIGVTTDEYVSKKKKFNVPYDTRVLRIKKYLEHEKHDNYRIMPLSDEFGDTIENGNYSGIVVSPETESGAIRINELRVLKGHKALHIFKMDHVLDEDGRIITSSRIMDGEIDESGKYKKNMKITVLGTSGGMSSALRASAGIVIDYKSTSILLDCGDLTSRQLQKARINVCDLDAIFISHAHIDHHIGLPMLVMHHMMMFGRTKPLDIYCPEEVSDALAIMFNSYPITSPFKIHFREMPYTANMKSLDVIPFMVDHEMLNAYGFKVINDRGKIVVFSGDTKPCYRLQTISEDADLLIHEATFASDWIKDTHGHTKIKEAIAIATEAKVHQLVLTHISLKYHGDMENSYAKDIVPTEFVVKIANDLDVFEV
jgi:pantetheine-phosphate adenylyltransferase